MVARALQSRGDSLRPRYHPIIAMALVPLFERTEKGINIVIPYKRVEIYEAIMIFAN